MKDIIKNWKFGIILLSFFIISITIPLNEDYIVEKYGFWLGLFLVICFFGSIYEIFKWNDKRKAKHKKKVSPR